MHALLLFLPLLDGELVAEEGQGARGLQLFQRFKSCLLVQITNQLEGTLAKDQVTVFQDAAGGPTHLESAPRCLHDVGMRVQGADQIIELTLPVNWHGNINRVAGVTFLLLVRGDHGIHGLLGNLLLLVFCQLLFEILHQDRLSNPILVHCAFRFPMLSLGNLHFLPPIRRGKTTGLGVDHAMSLLLGHDVHGPVKVQRLILPSD
mmetsp:Transcript_104845/g.240364  ORF Transcript_104845/g.240364 Transcript_104845/m.240364 type:complete len:205 (-) Transcript_104845:660-1274(-)